MTGKDVPGGVCVGRPCGNIFKHFHLLTMPDLEGEEENAWANAYT